MQNNRSFVAKKSKQTLCYVYGSYSHLLTMLLLFLTLDAVASDHIDGQISIQHPIADITDLFAFTIPEQSNRLVLIANFYPLAPRNAHFSSSVLYDFILSPASINNNSQFPLFQVDTKLRISCHFESSKKDHNPNWLTCNSDFANSVRTQVDDVHANWSENGMRVFAGRRSDPFFFNFDWAGDISTKGIIPEPRAKNSMKAMNVLSIVIEIDLKKYFATEPPRLLAIAAETYTKDSVEVKYRRIDRIGRPEITNVALIAHDGEDDLRDLYNQEKPFDLSSTNITLYRERLHKNIKYFDQLDGKQDWQKKEIEHYVELLLRDYLVIDLSKPCDLNRPQYLAIELALLDSEKAQTCGGRHPNDDIMDRIFTTFINAGSGEHIRDGVDQPTFTILPHFPYLAEPIDTLWAVIKAWFMRSFIY